MKRGIVFLLLVLTACSNRNSVPGDIIAPDAMRQIMKDVILADAYSTSYLYRDSLKPDKIKANQDLLEGVFKIHHTDRQAFAKSLAFYESRPDLSKNLFDSLAAYAKIHQTDLYTPAAVTHPGAPGNHPSPVRPATIPLGQRHVPGTPPMLPGQTQPRRIPAPKTTIPGSKNYHKADSLLRRAVN